MDPISQRRLFISLPTPESVRQSIGRAQAEIKATLPDKAVRWSRVEQFHVTLRFLGNVETALIELLIEKLTAACRPFRPLHLRAAELGFFPERRFPRVLWVGVVEPSRRLSQLWSEIQQVTSPFTKEPAEKEFVAHITLARLGRLKRPQLDNLRRVTARFDQSVFGDWMAAELELMQSELGPQGARPTKLAGLPFLGKS